MCTKSGLSAITSGIVRSYRETYRENLRQIYLYGSYARGDYDSESDIDLVAVVDGDRADLQRRLRSIWDVAAELGLEYNVVVSPTVIPESEFERFAEMLPYYAISAPRGCCFMLDSRIELIRYRLDTAKEKLSAAQVLLESENYKDSVGRSYYFPKTERTELLKKQYTRGIPSQMYFFISLDALNRETNREAVRCKL